MAKYKVVAYAANIGKKSVRAHSILDESEIPDDNLSYLLKNKFIRELSEEELKAIEAEEKLNKKGRN